MTLAVLYDVHGNLPALEAVLADIETLAVDAIYCGGDLVGYGPHPNEACALIEGRGIPTIYGNYDYAIGRDLEDCGCAYVTQNGTNFPDGTTSTGSSIVKICSGPSSSTR